MRTFCPPGFKAFFISSLVTTGVFLGVYQILSCLTREIDVIRVQSLGKNPSDIVVTHDGRILGIFGNAEQISIKEWDIKSALDSGQVPYEQNIPKSNLLGLESQSPPIPVFAISPDGNRFAWTAPDSDTLNVAVLDMRQGQLGAPERIGLQTKNKKNSNPDIVAAMAFLRSDLIALRHRSGAVNVWDISNRRRNGGTRVDPGWTILGYESHLIALSPNSGDVAIFKFLNVDSVDARSFNFEISHATSFARSKSGRALVGTSFGKIFELKWTFDEYTAQTKKDFEDLDYLETNGRGVESLAFQGNENIVIAGNPFGLFIKEGTNDLRKFSKCRPAGLVRVVGNYLIYVTSDSLEVAELGTVSPVVKDWPYLVCYFMTWASILLSLWQILVKPRFSS